MAEATEVTGRAGPGEFLTDVRDEVRKVTWPDWPQLKNATLVIVVFMLILALLIFGIDQIVSVVLNLIRSVLS